MSFPRQLIFFLRGSLSVSTLGSSLPLLCKIAEQLPLHSRSAMTAGRSPLSPAQAPWLLHCSWCCAVQAKLPTTQQSIIAPLDLYWLISCDGEASIFPSHADWQNGTSSGIANALQSMAAAGSQQPLVLPDIRLGTSSIGGSKLAHL